MDKDISLLVMSCDSYCDVADYFFDLKEINMPWWKGNCYLVNNIAKYEHKGVTVINAGNQLNWNGRLKKALNQIKEKYVLYVQEDYLIGDYVEETTIDEAINYMRDNEICYYKIDNFPRIRKLLANCDHLSYIPSNKRYGINLLTAIVDRKWFLSYLPDYDCSAWEVESFFLSKVTDHFQYNIAKAVLDTRQIIDIQYGVRQGKWWPPTIKFFLNKGYCINTSDRGLLPRKEVLRIQIGHHCNHLIPTALFRKMKRIAKKMGFKFVTED